MNGRELFIYKVKHAKSMGDVIARKFKNGKAKLELKNGKVVTIYQYTKGYRLYCEGVDLGVWNDMFWLAGKVLEVGVC